MEYDTFKVSLREFKDNMLLTDMYVHFHHCTWKPRLSCLCIQLQYNVQVYIVYTVVYTQGAMHYHIHLWNVTTIGTPLIKMITSYNEHYISKATSIVDDPPYLSHSLFALLPSGRSYRSICVTTTRLQNSLPPGAVRLLNTLLHLDESKPLLKPIFIWPAQHIYTL